MQVRSYLGTCSQTLELVQPSEGPLDDPADLAEPGAMRGASAGNHRGDPLFAKQVSVLVVVVASVGEQPAGPIPRPAPPASNTGDRLDERHQLSDVVAVSADQRHRKRGSVPVDDHMVLAAGAAAIDR